MHPLLIDIPKRFETERLIVRSYRFGDGAEYFSMIGRNKDHLKGAVSVTLLGLNNEEEAEIYLRKLINDWSSRKRFVLGAWEKCTKKFVAEIWIEANNWEDKIFEIGWFVERAHKGRGYVTEAAKASVKFIFEVLDAHKIMVTTGENNDPSYSVAERCGFIREGCLRQQKKLEDGTWRGTLYYGLLREEYGGIENL